MSDDGMDLCENIWSHEMAMRRLLLLLRQSQSQCNDIECFQPNQPRNDDGFMMMTICWMVVAFLLYFMRPSSIRNREKDVKPNNSGNGNGDEPPASPHAL
ncbi:unnamed protein product [Nezara viridula]|uniref:Small integral membrane protein 14 n=1 Tax=Nezara viridula TaxID=85310 RepID=A0A9P0HK76_NEZVI|nr:unnamed protein product [Nezara viridula]